VNGREGGSRTLEVENASLVYVFKSKDDALSMTLLKTSRPDAGH
jgi:hypothetical protein